jgi:putative flavoprotein involved in K+ transport
MTDRNIGIEMAGLPRQQAQEWLDSFERALQAQDFQAASNLFEEAGFLRDLLALSWDIRTFEGSQSIREFLGGVAPLVKPARFTVSEEPTIVDGITEAWVQFETATALCVGRLRLRRGKAWTLLTVADQLKGFEESVGKKRPFGTEHDAMPGRVTWQDKLRRRDEMLGKSEQPYVVVIGGGQAGLSLGARLNQLDVPVLVIDRLAKPGDTWRSRYRSLCLHDPVWYDHMPYLQFPDTWPVFTPKEKMGDFLESYAKLLEIPFWGNTIAQHATFDEARKEWTLQVEREGQPLTLRPKHIVFATGLSGFPAMPSFPGAEDFQGEQHHSSAHPGPDGWRGKKAVVIGSNNSAHDICAALWEEGADVTMLQRSSTLVVKSNTVFELAVKDLYSEEAFESGMTVEKADLIQASLPFRVLTELSKPLYEHIRQRDAAFYRGLAEAGFQLDFGEDGSGLWMKYMRRGSGYYIDVGASQLIIDGKIRLKNGEVEAIKRDGVLLNDGTELPADLIVYATGFGPMSQRAAALLPESIARKLGRVGGLGSATTKDPGPWEGEWRNMWRPTQQEGFWFHGGNLYQCRFFSKLLAMQLKARMEGIDTCVYPPQEVFHAA